MTACIAFLAAAVAVRNPFWPIGYEGTKEAISAEAKVEVAAAAVADTDETPTAGAVALLACVIARTDAAPSHKPPLRRKPPRTPYPRAAGPRRARPFASRARPPSPTARAANATA